MKILLLFLPLLIWIAIILVDVNYHGNATGWSYISSIAAFVFVLAAVVRAWYNGYQDRKADRARQNRSVL